MSFVDVGGAVIGVVTVAAVALFWYWRYLALTQWKGRVVSTARKVPSHSLRSLSLDAVTAAAQMTNWEAFCFDNRRNIIHVVHPTDVSAVLHASPSIVLKDAAVYESTEMVRLLGRHGLLTTPYGATYALHRRLVARSLSPERFKQNVFAECLSKHADALLAKWSRLFDGGADCQVTLTPYNDLAATMLLLTCDIFGFPVSNKVSIGDVVSSFRRLTAHASASLLEPPATFRRWLLNVISRSANKFDGSVQAAQDLVDDFVESIYSGCMSADHTPALSSVAAVAQNPLPSNWMETLQHSEKEVVTKDHIRTLLFAGFDTSCNALMSLLLLLADHGQVQDELAHEVRNSCFNTDSTGITLQSVCRLPLLHAVIKEGLRLHPPAPVVFRRVAVGSSLLLPHSRVHLPTHSTVAVNIFAAQRCECTPSAALSATLFDPRRWINAVQADVLPTFPFSGGTRSCLGRELAHAELLVMLSSLVATFAFSRPAPTASASTQFQITLGPGHALRLKLSLRSHSFS